MNNWYWIELIGFDNKKEDYAVSDFLNNVGVKIEGVSLFLYSVEFINAYNGYNENKKLDRSYCSYGAHPYNEERNLQIWSYAQLKGLVDELHKHNIKVVFSTFSTFVYWHKKKLKVGKFGSKDLKFREVEFKKQDGKFEDFGSVSVIKSFSNGTYYADYFVNQIYRIINDFDFDGIHLADGLSTHRRCLQVGDYSDDLVLRFLKKYQIKLPSDIEGPCDFDGEKIYKRYRYILENYRYEYTVFIAAEFGIFYKKLYKQFKNSGKIVLFNGAWTRDPFESLFRYGIDNREFDSYANSAYIFENMCASMPIYSTLESGGVQFSDEFRQCSQYIFQLTLLSLKIYSPKMKMINLTPIKDTQEEWNLIANHPNMLKKAIGMRNSAFILKNLRYVKASQGMMYCLSDAITKDSWSYVNNIELKSDIKRINGFSGYSFLFNDDIKKELKKYIDTRYLNSFELRKRLVSAGISFGLGTDIESIDLIDCPLICVNIQDYSDTDLKKLELYKGVLVVIGTKDVIKKTASVTISMNNSDIFCKIYNLQKDLLPIVIDNELVKTDISPDDAHEGLWTAPLKYENVNNLFFKKIVDILEEYVQIPKVVKGNAKVNAYRVNDTTWKIYVYNKNPHIDLITVSLPFVVEKAKSVIVKSALKSFSKYELLIKIPNDGIEIIECKVSKE